MYKLLVFDVDNTLLNSRGEIPQQVLNDTFEIQKNDYWMTIASGRSTSNLLDILDRLHCNVPFISSNGACINDNKNNVVLIHFPISTDINNRVIDIVSNHPNLGIILQYSEFSISDMKGFETWEDWYGDTNLIKPVNLRKMSIPDPLKIEILGENENIAEIRKDLINHKIQIEISNYSNNSLEITSKGITKGSGLRYITNYLHIPCQAPKSCTTYK